MLFIKSRRIFDPKVSEVGNVERFKLPGSITSK